MFPKPINNVAEATDGDVKPKRTRMMKWPRLQPLELKEFLSWLDTNAPRG